MKIYRLFIILVVFHLADSSNIYGQSAKELRQNKRAERKANTKKYRSPIMVYPVYWGIQDTRTTPGVYRVLGGGAAIRMMRIAPKYRLEHNGQFNIGLGRPNFENGAIQYSTQFLFETHYLRPYKESFFIGLHASGLQVSRITPALSNSSFASDAAFGIGPAVRWKDKVNLLKKETVFSLTLGVPFISYVNRVPEFGLSFSGTNSFIAPIGRFNKLSFRIDAKRQHKKSTENTINYFYRWEYYGMEEFDGLHNLRLASHQIGFHLWIKRN